MKRIASILLALMFILALLPCAASADTVDDLIRQYSDANTLDERLSLIHRIAEENAKAPSSSIWKVTDKPLGDALEGVLPENWEEYPFTETEGFPAEAKGRPCIVVEDKNQLGARLLISFPPEMIASSLAEAEYAVVIEDHRVKSDYQYTNANIKSYHWDYTAYLLDLRTGEAVKFWYNRQWAKRSGFSNELDAKPMMRDEIWEGIRVGIVNELRVEQADGSVLILGIEDGTCYVKGYEGEPVDIVIPSEVEGYAVTEIQADCFKKCETLKSVSLPGSVRWICSGAFNYCLNLEKVEFTDGLEGIGAEAFNCTALTEVVLPKTLRNIGDSAFCHCRNLVSVTMPDAVCALKIENFAFHYCERLSRMILPEGIRSVTDSYYVSEDGNMLYVYYPASLGSGLTDHNFNTGMVVYTPKGSYAAQWAERYGLEVVECDDPARVPAVSYAEEGPFAFRIIGEEAQLQYYTDNGEEEVVVPAEIDGKPVTTVLSGAFDYTASNVRTLRLPSSLLLVKHHAIEFSGLLHGDIQGELYIANPDAVLEDYAVTISVGKANTVTICAPAGSSAQRFVESRADDNHDFSGTFYFKEWSE